MLSAGEGSDADWTTSSDVFFFKNELRMKRLKPTLGGLSPMIGIFSPMRQWRTFAARYSTSLLFRKASSPQP